MAFTEFCCKSGGSNLNAGTRTGNSTEPGTAATFTYASGSWVSATGVFTVASGNPSTDGVAVGDFASVYADGATVTTLVGRVTAVSSTTITVSTTVKAGTTTDGTSNRTLKIGGAWAGPSGSVAFPLNFIASTVTNAAGNPPRVNLKNDQTYSISAAITIANNGPFSIQGYATSYGDTGRAAFVSSGTASFVVITVSGTNAILSQVSVNTASFTSGTVSAISLTGAGVIVERCVLTNLRNNGFVTNQSTQRIVECESVGASNSAFHFDLNNGGTAIRCIAHDSGTANSGGFRLGGSAYAEHCIADTIIGSGFTFPGTSGGIARHCVAYNCTSHGFSVTAAGLVLLENCVAISNATFGVNAGSTIPPQLRNCAFFGNTSGATTGAVEESGTIELTGGPFVDPANGDFRLNTTVGAGAALSATGRGNFLQTTSGYSGSISYPDVGAVQAIPSSGGIRLPRAQNGGYSA